MGAERWGMRSCRRRSVYEKSFAKLFNAPNRATENLGLSQGLFRQEVIDAQRGEWLGSIIVAAPMSRWLLTSLALALASTILLFLLFGHYTRRETVSGELVPSAGVLNVAAPSIGTVTQLRVHDGQQVKAGDVLLELSSEQASVALGDTHSLVAQQLDVQRASLQADLASEKKLSTQRANARHAKAVLLKAQLRQIEGQLALQRQQVRSNQELLARIKPLGTKGYVSAVQIQQQTSALLDAQAQYRALLRQQLDARQQLDTTHQQLEELPLDDAMKHNDIERQLASLSQSMAQNEMKKALVLRAPGDGVVSAVMTAEGQMVSAGQSLLSILPRDSALDAQFLVPSRVVGFIEPGNQVTLRYQAFPFQKFGQQYGRVKEMSRSALRPQDVASLLGQTTSRSEPLYRILVTLDCQQILAYGKQEPLKPGMAVDADIVMDKRRLIEWVFEPLYGIKSRLGRAASHG